VSKGYAYSYWKRQVLIRKIYKKNLLDEGSQPQNENTSLNSLAIRNKYQILSGGLNKPFGPNSSKISDRPVLRLVMKEPCAASRNRHYTYLMWRYCILSWGRAKSTFPSSPPIWDETGTKRHFHGLLTRTWSSSFKGKQNKRLAASLHQIYDRFQWIRVTVRSGTRFCWAFGQTSNVYSCAIKWSRKPRIGIN